MDNNALVKQRQQQLDQIYNPQIDLINQQMQAIPGRFDARRSSLEQAKTNAFRDITQDAQRRGMFFSGFQPQEQARHLGERFLPGMQDIESQQEQARLGLLEQLTGIRGQRSEGLMSFRDELRQEQVQRQQQERQFEQKRQLQQEQQRFTAGQASAGRAADRAGQGAEGWEIIERKSGGGLRLRGPGNRPVGIVEYARNTNTPLDSLLRQGSDYDKNALKEMNRLAGLGWPEANIMAFLRNNYPKIF